MITHPAHTRASDVLTVARHNACMSSGNEKRVLSSSALQKSEHRVEIFERSLPDRIDQSPDRFARLHRKQAGGPRSRPQLVRVVRMEGDGHHFEKRDLTFCCRMEQFRETEVVDADGGTWHSHHLGAQVPQLDQGDIHGLARRSCGDGECADTAVEVAAVGTAALAEKILVVVR